MPRGMSKVNGIVGTHRTERIVGLKAFHGLLRHFEPLVLVPSPTRNPISWLGSCCSLAYFLDQFLVGLHPHQVDFKFVVAYPHQVGMGLNDSWSHRLAG